MTSSSDKKASGNFLTEENPRATSYLDLKGAIHAGIYEIEQQGNINKYVTNFKYALGT